MAHSADTFSFPITLRSEHRLIFTRDVFASENLVLADVLTPLQRGERVRVLVFWDEGLKAPFPDFSERLMRWFTARGDQVRMAGEAIPVPGGEGVKNDFRQLERVWAAMNAAGLCRHSYVLVIGGGAVLDMVGFAAATAHRGIPVVRLPTTSLSQGDGGLGVKNGINYFGKKNWLGSFVVPHAVVNDLAFLDVLPPRARRAGLVEAMKVALIRDAAFFDFIWARVEALAAFAREPFEAVIRESARQHLEHIATGGDPFERGSARPLDFGHWAAHKLEQFSEFRLSHGEAVAIGMALDVIYSIRVGLLPETMGERILGVLHRLGFSLYTPELEWRGADGRRRLLEGLNEFREHLGGILTIPLIRAPGERVEVHEIDVAIMERAMNEVKERYGSRNI